MQTRITIGYHNGSLLKNQINLRIVEWGKAATLPTVQIPTIAIPVLRKIMKGIGSFFNEMKRIIVEP